MTYEIYKINFTDNKYRRTEKIENIFSINWNDDIEKAFISFDFTTNKKIKSGELIELYDKENQKTVFIGKITSIQRKELNKITYFGYDLGNKLCEHADTFDFKQSCVSNAIKEVCKRFKIPISETIIEDNTKFSHIYYKKQLDEIIFDILKKANKKYYIDCSSGYVEIKEPYHCNELYGYVANMYKINSLNLITGFSLTEKQTEDEESQEENHLKILGNYNSRKGVIINIVNKELNLNSDYFLTKTTHNIIGAKENVSIYIKNYDTKI